jgi:Nucleotidyl transferase AbiEii toxin, Type IV TA system
MLLPNKDLIREAAEALGIEAAFIEKDWFVTQLIKSTITHSSDRSISLIFSGGTALSKAHKKIDRFSEDWVADCRLIRIITSAKIGNSKLLRFCLRALGPIVLLKLGVIGALPFSIELAIVVSLTLHAQNTVLRLSFYHVFAIFKGRRHAFYLFWRKLIF